MKYLTSFLLLVPGILFAELSLPQFFSDHMVLQRERAAAIWGKADANSDVSVSFKGKTTNTKAGTDGKWRCHIDTGKADANGAVITITSGGKTVAIQDVLVGEVWFASGQSNMSFTVSGSPMYASLVAETNDSALRMFTAPRVTAVEPQEDIAGTWELATPKTVPRFSSVAFFFARKLRQELGIPIAVIHSSWGGKPIETFTSREALVTLPSTKKLVDAAMKDDAFFDPVKAKAQHEKQLAQWKKAMEDFKAKPPEQKGRAPQRPLMPRRAWETDGKPGVLFQSMIHPFIGYTMRGAIWYQGEANRAAGSAPYDQTLPLMIADWRKRWADDFSFYYVQLANFGEPTTEPGKEDGWVNVQDAMRRVLSIVPKTGMAVIHETGEAKDIHPKNKKDPGERLALWALAKDYGKSLVYSGPLYRKHVVVKDAIRISFEHVGAGLKSRDAGTLKRFEICGADGKWHWADARIDGKDSILVSNKEVKQPVAARYAWAANPEGANLVNSEGLPTSVFTTQSINTTK
ncbi:MAG: sialate O-acetylesterase [Akkermansiaceae bacterium]